MTSLIPYSFSSDVLPEEETVPLGAGQYHVLHFFVEAARLEWFLSRIELWFEDDEEVILVASGISAEGEGFIVMEWEECEINSLFLKILEHEDAVADICTYVRAEEEE